MHPASVDDGVFSLPLLVVVGGVVVVSSRIVSFIHGKLAEISYRASQEKGQACAPKPCHKVKIWPKINIFFIINHAGCVKQLCLQGELLCKSGEI